MRKIIALIALCFLLALCVVTLPTTAQAATTASGSCGADLSWNLDDSGTLTISGTGDMKNYSSAGAPWYSSRSSIKSVIVETGVTSIGNYAFYNCSNATSFSLPNSVATIGNYAFYSCSACKTFSIPEGVRSIGSAAFYYCTGLTSVSIPASVTSISDNAFYSCYALSSISVDANNPVFSSHNNVLFNKDKTTLIKAPGTIEFYTVPDTVTTIGAGAFMESNLISITLPQGLKTIGANAFFNCHYIYSISIPSSVTSIGDQAFLYCTNLQYKTSGNGKYLGNSSNPYIALVEATSQSITSFSFPSGTKFILDNAFFHCTKLTSLSIPNDILSIGRSAFSNCSGLTSVSIPQSVTRIGENAFEYCSSLTDIRIPDSVTSIGIQAFYECRSLTTVTLPKDIKTISERMFQYCINLSHIAIPDGVTEIQYCAFYSCSNLTSVFIPESILSIGSSAFGYCNGLTTVGYAGTASQWETIPISSGNDILSSVQRHDNASYSRNCIYHGIFCADCNDYVVKIYVENGKHTFSHGVCTQCGEADPSYVTIDGGNLGDNLTWTLDAAGVLVISGTGSMPSWTSWDNAPWYAHRDGIYQVVIQDGVTTVGDYAFYNCYRLLSVSLCGSITEIGDYAFYWCSALGSITLPEQLITIGAGGFEMSGLYGIRIPASVTSIGSGAFGTMESLTAIVVDENNTVYASDDYGVLFNKDKTVLIEAPTIYKNGVYLDTYAIPDGVTTILPDAFTDYQSYLQSVTIPVSVTSVDNWSFPYSITTVYYRGTEADRTANNLGKILTSATWHYNSCVGAVTHSYSSGHDTVCDGCGQVRTLESLVLTKAPDKVSYLIGDTLELAGITLEGTYSDGTKVTLGAEALENVSANLSSAGKKTVQATVSGVAFEFEIYVHATSTKTVTVDSSLYPQSDHVYANNLDQTKTFTYPGATSLKITFSSQTELENNYDKLYVYDGNGTLIKQYTGTAAANITLTISGDTFKITLTTDVSVQKYGYSFSKIQAITTTVEHPAVAMPTTATCTQSGYTGGSCCEICGLVLVQPTPIAALGHDWIAATCLDAKTCNRCGLVEGEALGHNWLDATCTVPSTCDRCRDTQGEALGHNWQDATCTAPSTCDRCGDTQGEALGHDQLPATCTLPITCTRCTETWDEPLGHSGVWFALVPPTCEGSGIHARICTVCRYTESRTQPATGHHYQQVVVPPTCTQQGYTTTGCLDCGDVTVTDYVPATGHTWSDWIQTAVPTCHTEGAQMRFCYCGTKETEVLEILPHSYENGTCISCGEAQFFVLRLTKDTQVALTLDRDLYVDLNGFRLTGTIATNGFAIYGMDTSTDSYSCAQIGSFSCVDETGNPLVPQKYFTANAIIAGREKQYLTICTDGSYSFHRFYMGITHMSLSCADMGLGYKATIWGDAMVLAQLDSEQGFSFWLQLEGNRPVGSHFQREQLVSGQSVSLRIRNFDVDNYGEARLSAIVSIKLADGTVIDSPMVSDLPSAGRNH